MVTKADRDRKVDKAAAVAKRLEEMAGKIDLLAGMLEESTLDQLILALGLGKVELS